MSVYQRVPTDGTTYNPAEVERLIAEAREALADLDTPDHSWLTANGADVIDQLEALRREHDHWSSQTNKWRSEYEAARTAADVARRTLFDATRDNDRELSNLAGANVDLRNQLEAAKIEIEQLRGIASQVPGLTAALDEARWEREVVLQRDPAAGQVLNEITRLRIEVTRLTAALPNWSHAEALQQREALIAAGVAAQAEIRRLRDESEKRIHTQESAAVESGWVELDNNHKLDLDDLERKARAATAICADVDLNDNDRILALIARIRELEGKTAHQRELSGRMARLEAALREACAMLRGCRSGDREVITTSKIDALLAVADGAAGPSKETP